MQEGRIWNGERVSDRPYLAYIMQSPNRSTAIGFLESMGLPKHMLSVTRKQLEQGKIDFASSPEYKMYSRHDGTSDD